MTLRDARPFVSPRHSFPVSNVIENGHSGGEVPARNFNTLAKRELVPAGRTRHFSNAAFLDARLFFLERQDE
jgi:hypothetical protein